ncbi:S-layer homology domain-containing protein [Paenibacillus sp. 1P07SE]|uniref:S-layer homology domain-containing protein n=1 Tax=Paenibacillus sp. 1P07SE TaxID=3132209 RepID=UPI0039A6EF88
MLGQRLLLMAVSLLLLLSAWPVTPASAKEAEPFRLAVAEQGSRVEIIITVVEAKDLYAWDLEVAYDPARLKWLDAKTSLPGLSVPPIRKESQVRFAHTSTGAVPGRDGTFELARLGFQRLHDGGTSVELKSAKLVDAELAMVEYAPGTAVVVEAGPARIAFADLEQHWSRDAVLDAVARGFVTGFEDGTFRPDQPVTRQEFAVLLSRAAGLSGDMDSGPAFSDTDALAPWALPYIREAAARQWITGYEDGTFRGLSLITRQELAAVLARTMDGSGEIDPAVLSGFADRQELGEWAVQPLALLVEAGILQGRGERLLAPRQQTTRAEAVTLILRVLPFLPAGSG